MSSERLSRAVGENTGNIVFTHAIKKHLENYGHIPWSNTDSKRLQNFEACIVPSANYIGKHADMGFLYDKLEDFYGPILLLGIGAQASNQGEEVQIPSGTKKLLQLVANSVPKGCPNIGVRGYFTQDILRKADIINTFIIGCPSNFISPLPDLGLHISNSCSTLFERVAVCSSHVRWKHLRKAERDLYAIMEETGGIYINQSPASMISAGIQSFDTFTSEFSKELALHTKPGLGIPDLYCHIKRYYRSYFSFEDWSAAVRRCSLVIGARIHGCMVAIQAGVPAICIAHDSRTEELCQIMRIPHFVRSEITSGISKDMIRSKLISFDWKSYDKARAQLLSSYCNLLDSNSIPTSVHLNKLANELGVSPYKSSTIGS